MKLRVIPALEKLENAGDMSAIILSFSIFPKEKKNKKNI